MAFYSLLVARSKAWRAVLPFAGDIFGEFKFERELKVGDRLSFIDAAGYTMVKKNWFNGVKMPAIAVRELDGSVTLVKEFTFDDFVNSLS